MNLRSKILIMLVLVGTAASGLAEEIAFFKASESTEEDWSWSGAHLYKEGSVFEIQEQNDTLDYGDVFPSDSFPYIGFGQVELEVKRVHKGEYTLQLLCFHGNTEMKPVVVLQPPTSADRRHTYDLSAANVQPGTQAVQFKLWVVHEDGAKIDLKDLDYSISFKGGDVTFREKFVDEESWTAENLVVNSANIGATLSLAEGFQSGTLFLDKRFPKSGVSAVLVHAPEVNKGRITVQMIAFDAGGMYLGGVDAAKDVGKGWHGLPLDTLAWPDETDQIAIKIWVSGPPESSAQINDVILFKSK